MTNANVSKEDEEVKPEEQNGNEKEEVKEKKKKLWGLYKKKTGYTEM